MAVAEESGASILSVDSMQVYQEMDIGTAKPTPEERRRVIHHMLDLVPPEEAYTVARFRADARRALEEATTPVVLIVGGSGLHFRSVVDPMRFRPGDPDVRARLQAVPLDVLVEELRGVDPEAERHVDLANPRRVVRAVETWRVGGITPTAWVNTPESRAYAEYRPEIDFVGFMLDRADLGRSIRKRLHAMRQAGFLDEVERLADRLGPTASQAVGYKQLLSVVRGETTVDQGFDAAERATVRLARRQRTFFRRDPRLEVLEGGPDEQMRRLLKETMN